MRAEPAAMKACQNAGNEIRLEPAGGSLDRLHDVAHAVAPGLGAIAGEAVVYTRLSLQRRAYSRVTLST